MERSLSVLILLVLVCALFHTAAALPEFASRTGYKCQSCHVNPSGGMLRQILGDQYGRESLPVPDWSAGFATQELPEELRKVLGIGADFRTLYFSRRQTDSLRTGANLNAFWQMQGDLYLDFHPSKRVSFFLMKGLYTGFEAFGLLKILPASGHIKIGKFLPNYGTRLDDHTAFVRTYTGFSPEQGRPELTGVETGISPGPFSLTAGLFNSTDGFGAAVGSSKAFLGRIEGMFDLGASLHLGLGGNFFSKKNDTGGRTVLLGGFGSFSYGALTVLGETDLKRLPSTTGFLTFVQASILAMQGLDVFLSYDFYDPDIDNKGGAFSRYSIGASLFPYPGVEVHPVYRLNTEEPGSRTNTEFDVVFHIYI